LRQSRLTDAAHNQHSETRRPSAINAYRAALQEWTRERVPLDWAATQDNLGSALSTLGERESGTARLEEAVTAHRAALQEWTRERVPLDWAATQNNLGGALSTLGERESGAVVAGAGLEALGGDRESILPVLYFFLIVLNVWQTVGIFRSALRDGGFFAQVAIISLAFDWMGMIGVFH
jgi:hypothetical protein